MAAGAEQSSGAPTGARTPDASPAAGLGTAPSNAEQNHSPSVATVLTKLGEWLRKVTLLRFARPCHAGTLLTHAGTLLRLRALVMPGC